MRAKEFIMEATAGRLSSSQQNPSRGLHKFSDGEKWNGDYKQYRLGLALACTDGTNMPEVDFESWVGRWKTAHPYTKAEADMLRIAYIAAKIEHEDLNHGDMNSKEPPDTYTVSPISNWMNKNE